MEEQTQRKIQKNSPRVDSWKFRVDSGTLELQRTVLESTPELYESTPTENKQKNRELIFSATVLESTPRSTPRLRVSSQVDSRTANRQNRKLIFSRVDSYFSRVDSSTLGGVTASFFLAPTALFLSLTARFLFPSHPKL